MSYFIIYLQISLLEYIEKENAMTLDEILKGESKNIEFKSELPKKSERYIKSIIAFSI